TPIKVPKWINIYSPNDVIGYPLKGINNSYAAAPIQDMEMNVGGWLARWNPMSHIAYFDDRKVLDLIANTIHNT
ncbi:hypothetical protein ACSTI7_23310, partial [Vibrio parahaemolyticus]